MRGAGRGRGSLGASPPKRPRQQTLFEAAGRGSRQNDEATGKTTGLDGYEASEMAGMSATAAARETLVALKREEGTAGQVEKGQAQEDQGWGTRQEDNWEDWKQGEQGAVGQPIEDDEDGTESAEDQKRKAVTQDGSEEDEDQEMSGVEDQGEKNGVEEEDDEDVEEMVGGSQLEQPEATEGGEEGQQEEGEGRPLTQTDPITEFSEDEDSTRSPTTMVVEEETPGTPVQTNRSGIRAQGVARTVQNRLNPYARRRRQVFKHQIPAEYLDGQPNICRFDMRICVPPSTDPLEAMRNTIEEIFTIFNKIDESFAIFPWSEQDRRTSPIKKEADIPHEQGDILKFFPGIKPDKKGGMKYCRVMIAYTRGWDNLMSNVSWWLDQERHGLWKRQIQYEKVETLGWLLYSHRGLEEDHLKEVILQKTDIEVGLRYRAVRIGAYDPNRKKEDMVMATHIEVAAHEYEDADKIIGGYYSASSTNFPSNIRMRLVPTFETLGNRDSREKARHLAAKQLAWTSNIKSTRTWEIATLDRTCSQNNMTLREMILAVPHPTKHTQLFHGVARGFRNDSVLLTYVPQYESEAQMMIAGLLPYLKGKHGHWVTKEFTESAVRRADEAIWDKEKNMVVTKNDTRIDALDEADGDLDLTTEHQTVEIEMLPRDTRAEAPVPGEDDSISTFRTARRQARRDRSTRDTRLARALTGTTGQEERSQRASSAQSASGEATVASSVSWNSRVTSVETELASVQGNVSRVQNSVQAVEGSVRGLSSQMERVIQLLGGMSQTTGQGNNGYENGATTSGSARRS